ncbi:methylamine utilization protein MauG [Bacterioplanes sanyensis]|uniref:cytochrome-c peroxidase n=1 Tax=Bacterioplanes sanyensis TaxID=1249553 RepID=UPI001679C9BA|nr:cytochrome c peroxidase [Bacterioplanes sanyensis]GGY38901.1 methylamine utilization protein MauG [Bacterioplanes sanyensis]
MSCAYPLRLLFYSALMAGLSGCGGSSSSNSDHQPDTSPLSQATLGKQLFFDTNLSASRTQSCASCHDPEHGFIDSRTGADGLMRFASLGDDEVSLGDRNAPTAAYAQFSPEFYQGQRQRFNTDGDFSTYQGYLGGQFHDGRADDLAAQAGGPPLNPAEMNMPDKAAVVSRLLENDDYQRQFTALFGADIWDDTDAAYAAMTQAIGEFEKSTEFAPFDSRYDRSLLPVGDANRYTYHPASKAALGKALFFSTEFTNCAACHQLKPQGQRGEVFTGFEYHNLGVPENTALRALNGASGPDLGLQQHVDETSLAGKFKTPTLRNVAVTGPYMHNGVFRQLDTVLLFYEHARQRANGKATDFVNPETGVAWRAPEVDRNLSNVELGSGSKDLSDKQNREALECFLMSLTDARYEHLLDATKVTECGL